MVEKTYQRAIIDNLDIVIFDFYQFYTQSEERLWIKNPFLSDMVYNLETTPELLCYVNNAAWNKLYRKKLFTDYNITYPFGYRHQDLGTTPKLLYLAKCIGFVNQPLYNYLIDRPNNLTQQYDRKIYHIIDMNREYLDYYREQKVFSCYYEQLKYLCIINILNSLKKVLNYSDMAFVNQFVDDAFGFMKNYFPDYPTCIYNIYPDKHDRIYLNKILLKMYLCYRQWREKRK
ncbi:hypothetical protein SDC9_161907 [bioreactor metagenome]|uniref:Uncharacterized protein n=1 Tax=bioreactor metagenome TaxID=1076179 RepID=A0A645FKU9_9ZZZZ